MKELSIEQKAKAYDEIIKKANKMHSENCEICKTCIEELIPELVESAEDVDAQINSQNEAIKQLNSALNSMEHNGHLPKMMTAAESLGISEEEYAKIEDEFFKEQEYPVSEVWHNASKEPNDMSHCLIYYGCKESVGNYLHYESVLYNKKEKVFVTPSFPHPTGYKVEQKSIDGGCVAEVYKNKRDRILISDITQWCYLKDLHNFSNVQRTVKNWKEEPVSEDLEKELHKVWDRETLDEYAYQVAYDLSNDWMKETPTWDDVETACKLGAEWKERQMMRDAVDAEITKISPNDHLRVVSDVLPLKDESEWGTKVKLMTSRRTNV